MSGADILIVTTVHPPDDPRIRDRTAGTLASGGLRVVYACPEPGPDDRAGLAGVVALRGGRVARLARAMALLSRHDAAVVSVHDPELFLPAAVIGRMRRRAVVVDVHENLPARVGGRAALLRGAVAVLLRLVERLATITLAEAGYRAAFADAHPVLPNHPDVRTLPTPRSPAEPAPSTDAPVVYVGDVSVARGVTDLLAAMPHLDRTLMLVGRCQPDLAATLQARAEATGVDLRLLGWLPHPRAMAVLAAAAVAVSPLRDHPNYRHSLPTKVLEYLALGIATVATDLPGTRAAIGGQPGVVLVPPGSPNELAAGIRAALDPAVAAAARRAAGTIPARFPAPTAAVLDLYARLAAR